MDYENRTVVGYDHDGEIVNERPFSDEENYQADFDEQVSVQGQLSEAMAAASRDIVNATVELMKSSREDGLDWVQPTGVHDAYWAGATVTHNGKTWESLVTANVWEPGVTAWREAAADGIAGWIQPLGAHDAYTSKDLVRHHEKLWKSDFEVNVWEPGVYGWTEYTPEEPEPAPEPEVSPWVEPTGAHDAYHIGDKVTFDGRVWICTVDNNVWSPGVYGWSVL